MSVFETWAVSRGRPLFFEEHAQRLVAAARELLGAEAAAVAADAARAAATPEIREGVLRVYVSAGAGELCGPVSCPGAWLLEEECEVGAGPGAGSRVVSSASPYCPSPGGWKTGNYWANIRALQAARAAGAEEALLFDGLGILVGCACANVFVRLDGQWQTPGRDCGARDGVVRSWVLRRLGAREATLRREDLARVEEMFLTNSRVGILGVAVVDERGLPPSDSARRLAREYAREVLHC